MICVAQARILLYYSAKVAFGNGKVYKNTQFSDINPVNFVKCGMEIAAIKYWQFFLSSCCSGELTRILGGFC